mgnify:CR=1 FL=1
MNGRRKEKDVESFKQAMPWPPVWWMELPAMMHGIMPELPFGIEDKRYADIFKAHIIYLKTCSRAAFDFYSAVEEKLK